MNTVPFNPNKFRPDQKKYAPVKEKKGLKTKKKPTGELELFKAIWILRPHVSEFSGEPIEQFAPIHFLHILPKKMYPHFRLVEKFIRLGTEDEHIMHHAIPRSEWTEPFKSKMELWENEAKEIYKQKHPNK